MKSVSLRAPVPVALEALLLALEASVLADPSLRVKKSALVGCSDFI